MFNWFKKKPPKKPVAVKIMFQGYGEVKMIDPPRIPQRGDILFPNHRPMMRGVYKVVDVSIELFTHPGPLGHSRAVEITEYTIFCDPVEGT